MQNNQDFNLPLEEGMDTSSVHAVPVAVSGWSYESLGEDWEFFEALTAEVDPAKAVVVDGSGRVVMALDANAQMVTVADGDGDAYLELNEGEDGEPVKGSLTDENLTWLREEFELDVETGPRMNYWYPITGIDEYNAAEAALIIRGLNLCVVEVDGDYGLALTGGGQDFSWDIAAAYVALGILPPIHFADLPQMAGVVRADNPKQRYTYEAMQRSLKIAAEQVGRASERLAEAYPFWSGYERACADLNVDIHGVALDILHEN